MLVSVADDLAQVTGQILAGKRQGAPRQLRRAGLTLGWRPGGGHISADAGGGGGGGCGGSRRWQRCGAGCPAEGVQRLDRG